MQREPSTLELAEERTNWALERTRLAKERTYAAWFRTGMAAVGIGLAMEKFVPTTKYSWVLEGLGILFVCAGMLIFGMGFKTYYVVMKKLAQEGYKGIPTTFMAILTVICFMAAILALVLIILD